MPAQRATLLATLACVIAAGCWAANAVIATGAFERGVTPAQLAQARVVVALVPLALVLVVARRDLLRPPRGSVPALLSFGASMVVVNVSYYVAIDRVPVGVAISFQYTAPVLILAGVALITRRSPLQSVVTRLDADAHTFPPLLASVQLPQGLDTTLTDFVVYAFGGGEPTGIYTVFTFLTPPGALTDGRMDPDDVVELESRPFVFSP